jgi:hypothetical protein
MRNSIPVAQWLRRVTTNHEIEGSSPSGDVCGPVAQWLARLTSNQAVEGSSPSGIVFDTSGPHTAVETALSSPIVETAPAL